MKPILFNTSMVQAIIEGRKTVTRRNPFKFVMKEGYNPEWSGYSLGEYCTGRIDSGACLYSRGAHDVWGVRSNVVKPKYKVGDILYIRETWCESRNKYYYKADKKCTGCDELGTCLPKGTSVTPVCELCEYSFDSYKWHPSIHMPKEAARLFLRVKEVRVERLSNMTVKDMIAEGVNMDDLITASGIIEYRVINRWEELWDSTIPKDKLSEYGVDANPWVWVIEFNKISKEEAYGRL